MTWKAQAPLRAATAPADSSCTGSGAAVPCPGQLMPRAAVPHHHFCGTGLDRGVPELSSLIVLVAIQEREGAVQPRVHLEVRDVRHLLPAVLHANNALVLRGAHNQHVCGAPGEAVEEQVVARALQQVDGVANGDHVKAHPRVLQRPLAHVLEGPAFGAPRGRASVALLGVGVRAGDGCAHVAAPRGLPALKDARELAAAAAKVQQPVAQRQERPEKLVQRARKDLLQRGKVRIGVLTAAGLVVLLHTHLLIRAAD
mmetsp:Transcript_11857/g.30366  ORF Transcript_11857/g.30366 Transcript_11857/m.30366 type:complete len:256 (+) Transcript_11857:100-867(+)